MKIYFYYGSINLEEDVITTELYSENQLLHEICSIIDKYEQVVYLIYQYAEGGEIYEDTTTINITELPLKYLTLLRQGLEEGKNNTVGIFVFESYEDAYKIAQDMREENNLSYSEIMIHGLN